MLKVGNLIFESYTSLTSHDEALPQTPVQKVAQAVTHDTP